MEMMFFKLWLCLLCAVAVSHGEEEGCRFVVDKRTYFCSGIKDRFPSQFFGNFHLKCSDCNIPIFSPETFPIQAELVSFNISSSGITNITSGAFGVLPLLQYLYLQDNKIQAISADAFINLRQLFELDLYNNELEILPPGVFNGMDAVSVNLHHNQLKEVLPDTFKGTLGIMALNMSHNRIGILHKNSFKYADNLEVLDLEHNNLCYIPLGMFQYIQMVKDLNLSANKLRSFLPGTFSGLNTLLKLDLASNDFFEVDPAFLLSLPKISTLDISRNGLVYFDAQALHSNAPTIRKLLINENLWSCSVLKNLVQYFKIVNVDTIQEHGGRYDVTNYNGIACSMEHVHTKIPLSLFWSMVNSYTNQSINYC